LRFLKQEKTLAVLKREKQTSSDFSFQNLAEPSSTEKLRVIVYGTSWLTKALVVSEVA
jgi:hypothetical protein